MSDDLLLRDYVPAIRVREQKGPEFACVDAMTELARLAECLEPKLGFSMCRHSPPGHCLGFVTPNAGDGNSCANCGHSFSIHD